VETRLVLDCATRKEHRRVVRPALPECNHHTLLKLIQLDLEMHRRKRQSSACTCRRNRRVRKPYSKDCLLRKTPEAGRLEVLLAGFANCSARTESAHRTSRQSSSGRFPHGSLLPNTSASPQTAATGTPASPLRMLRPPRTVGVEMKDSRMAALVLDGRKLSVFRASGPWKASGTWWTHSEWCREEWDVALGEQERLCCRVATTLARVAGI